MQQMFWHYTALVNQSIDWDHQNQFFNITTPDGPRLYYETIVQD
jgi:hypothetical protein